MEALFPAGAREGIKSCAKMIVFSQKYALARIFSSRLNPFRRTTLCCALAVMNLHRMKSLSHQMGCEHSHDAGVHGRMVKKMVAGTKSRLMRNGWLGLPSTRMLLDANNMIGFWYKLFLAGLAGFFLSGMAAAVQAALGHITSAMPQNPEIGVAGIGSIAFSNLADIIGSRMLRFYGKAEQAARDLLVEAEA